MPSLSCGTGGRYEDMIYPQFPECISDIEDARRIPHHRGVNEGCVHASKNEQQCDLEDNFISSYQSQAMNVAVSSETCTELATTPAILVPPPPQSVNTL
jgi:hypothetical protein